MISNADFKKMQQWLTQLEPLPAHQASAPPDVANIYAPNSHEAALDPDRTLVVGGRGVGKSFWAAALLNSKTREIISTRYPKLGLKQCTVTLGFAEGDSIAGGPPSLDVIDQLLTKDKFRPEVIWRAVIIHSLREYLDIKLPTDWRGKKGLVAWVNDDAERMQLNLRLANDFLMQKKIRHIIVFDALDRLGENWTEIRERSKALMKIALAFRSYQAIKLKIFMRIDQAEDTEIQDFPDASKIMGAKVDLKWERRDLYGLLFTLLANHAPANKAFQKVVKEELGIILDKTTQRGLIPDLMSDETKQERLFAVLAGQYMGSDRRRGRTYLWMHNHLSDAFGQVSPRTFLVALRTAAENGHEVSNKVIDPKGIQIGLQAASERRVEQLHEDFFWIRDALEPLADLQVPCEDKALFDRWKAAKTISLIEETSKRGKSLAPLEFESAAGISSRSLLNAMRRLGVAERRPDGRINVPDIYRVAAKLLRKGGVKPTR
jgi:hypothetical protein